MATYKLLDKDNLHTTMNLVSENMDYVDSVLTSIFLKKELNSEDIILCKGIVKNIQDYSNFLSKNIGNERVITEKTFHYNMKIKDLLKNKKPPCTESEPAEIISESEDLVDNNKKDSKKVLKKNLFTR